MEESKLNYPEPLQWTISKLPLSRGAPMKKPSVLFPLIVSAPVFAAQPGAYSVLETDLSAPEKAPKTYVRCLQRGQVDKRGFLVPSKTLANDKSCKVMPANSGAANAYHWSASCAGDTKYAVKQHNVGNDFEMDVTMEFAGLEDKTSFTFKATTLDRACAADEESF